MTSHPSSLVNPPPRELPGYGAGATLSINVSLKDKDITVVIFNFTFETHPSSKVLILECC